MNESRIRHDPLYRVIDVKDEMFFFENRFKKDFDRLKQINNLGIIPEVLEMAKHSKYEHYSGTMYQIESLIDIQEIEEKYKVPLRVSAIFLHLKHLPYTYSTERSLLLASYFDEDIKEFIRKNVSKVADFLKIEEKDEILEKLFSLYSYKDLYKYLSAFFVIENWRGINHTKIGLSDEQKSIVLNNMVNHQNYGYKLLDCSDKVDYVQRDSLYFGTARIDISPKHIYKKSKDYIMDEKTLIDFNLAYLEERFYQNSEVRFFTALYEKILAKLMMSKNFDVDLLFELNDLQFKKLMTENVLETSKGNYKGNLSPNSINIMKNLFNREIKFSKVFELSNISFEKQSAIELEYKIIRKDKKSKGLLDYPFKKNILLTVDYVRYVDSEKIHPNRQIFSINVFQNDDQEIKIEFIELFNLVKKIRDYCSICDLVQIEEGICKQFSWKNSIRINKKPVIRALAKIIDDINRDDPSTIKTVLRDIKSKKLFKKIVEENYSNHMYWIYLESSLEQEDDEIRLDGFKYLVRFLLSFPAFLTYKQEKDFINEIHERLLNGYYREPENVRGNYFEALWLVDRLLENPNSKLIFNGMIVINPENPKEKTDENEFDVIEISLDAKLNCNLYACSISDSYREDNYDQLRRLAENIHSKYSDLCIKAFYVIPENKNIGNWNPSIKETGIVWNC